MEENNEKLDNKDSNTGELKVSDSNNTDTDNTNINNKDTDNKESENKGKTRKPLKGFLITLIAATLIIVFVVIPVISLLMYNMIFGIRYETPAEISFRVEDFPGLSREHYEFPSDKGQMISAYRYYRDSAEVEPDANKVRETSSHTPQGVVILAHGIGAGHNSYMDVANYFTTQGFEVFAYDVTGNDESEGKSIKGLPQGIIDLEHAISFVEEQEEFEDLPIFLFGHSWGGYSVTAVLNKHPEVDAVCSVSGFNTSSDLIEAQGEQMIGPAIKVMLPTLYVYERISFGEYSNMTAMEGFEKSDADVMIIHSADDDTVPIRFGYDIYYEKYQNDPRFHFLKYEDKGHSTILSSEEGIKYSKELRKQYKEYFGESTPSQEEKQKFYDEHLDREKKGTLVNTELLDLVCDFYRDAIEEKN